MNVVNFLSHFYASELNSPVLGLTIYDDFTNKKLYQNEIFLYQAMKDYEFSSAYKWKYLKIKNLCLYGYANPINIEGRMRPRLGIDIYVYSYEEKTDNRASGGRLMNYATTEGVKYGLINRLWDIFVYDDPENLFYYSGNGYHTVRLENRMMPKIIIPNPICLPECWKESSKEVRYDEYYKTRFEKYIANCRGFNILTRSDIQLIFDVSEKVAKKFLNSVKYHSKIEWATFDQIRAYLELGELRRKQQGEKEKESQRNLPIVVFKESPKEDSYSKLQKLTKSDPVRRFDCLCSNEIITNEEFVNSHFEYLQPSKIYSDIDFLSKIQRQMGVNEECFSKQVLLSDKT